MLVFSFVFNQWQHNIVTVVADDAAAASDHRAWGRWCRHVEEEHQQTTACSRSI